MGETTKTTATFKTGGNAIGLGLGNGVAYFAIWYLETYKGVAFKDPLLAMAMGGGIVSGVLLELGRIGRAIKYAFDRVFPAKYDHEHDDHHEG